MADLKPCPFCGGKATIVINPFSKPKTYDVCCVCCTAKIKGYTNEELAELNWNTRVNEKGGSE